MLEANMGSFRTSRIFDVCFIAIVACALLWAATHRTFVGDKLFFINYHPSAFTLEIADTAGLNDAGKHLLYRTDPTFTDLAAVTAACDTERLGCLDNRQHAFILDDSNKPNQTIVTTAHEMLHLAYSRLSEAKKAELAPLLDAAINQFGPAGLSDELQSETSRADRRDEAHSLLGTEYSPLDQKLETYYADYFSDRTKVVKAAASDK
jgi:hypothetical protein